MTVPAPTGRTPVLCSAWATLGDVPTDLQSLVDEPTWERVLMQASEILWALSGRRWYGNGCEETTTLRSRPPTAGSAEWPYDPSWGNCGCWRYGTWLDGYLYAPSYGRYPGITHPDPVAIKLPRSPIDAVSEVVDRGAVLAPADYRLTRSGWLERIDGGHWVMCGDVTTVTYTFGEPPPEGGVQAAVILAIEIARDVAGDSQCQLPQRVTSITRQGVSMSMIDPMEFLPSGRTGLYMVDLWLASVNPHGRPARGHVFSLDVPTMIKGATTDVP